MLRLMLLRHAQATQYAGGGDAERPLNERGRREAQSMGDYLAQQGLFPDLAVVSPARRTRETLELALDVFGEPCPVLSEPRLYLAEAPQLFEMMRATADHVRLMLVVGHNPGFHDLAVELVGAGDRAARLQLETGLPTCGLVVIDFDAENWAEVTPGSGMLDRFVIGADLRR